MSHRWFRLETIKVTLIVVFHTPSLQVSISWQIFLNVHLLSVAEKALSSCIKHKKITTDHNKYKQRGYRWWSDSARCFPAFMSI